MTARVGRRSRRLGFVSAWLVLATLASGCDLPGGGSSSDGPTTTPPTSAGTSDAVSQFTHDGTFQSHIAAPGVKKVDFVYTLYPTKSTPRTNEWYPTGKKYFSFTFQAYDLAQKIRAPFASKRKVYLDTIKVTSATTTSNGGKTQHPYKLSAEASRITFDPEAVTTRYGMLITSPKGAFELRNQPIRATSSDTIGVALTFKAVVNVETRPGSTSYVRRTIKQVVPITIFASKDATVATKIPVDAN